MGIKEFSKATAKLAIALFVAGTAIALAGWGVVEWRDAAEKRDAVQYKEVKDWRLDVLKNLKFELLARTKLVEGELMGAVRIDGYPDYLSHPALQATNSDASLVLNFLDADGFKIYEKALKMSDFSTTVDGDGRKVGLNLQFKERLSVSEYKSFARARLRWTLVTEIPAAEKPAAVPTGDKILDHCAPNISRAERLRRLGLHGAVRDKGLDSFSAGSHELMFSYGGGSGLISCR